MKILFLNTNIGYGGAEKMIIWLANQCAESGHQVTFFTYRDSQVLQPVSSLVNHVHVQLESQGANLSFFKTVKYLHDFIKIGNFEVGISFLSPSMLRMAMASIGTDMRMIFSHRGDPYYSAPTKNIKLKLFGKLNKWAFKQADYYVFQTEMAKKFFSQKIQDKSIVIPNPIRPLSRTIERDGKVQKKIVTVGRLDIKQKRQDVLIEAFNMISNQYPEYELLIYGSGEDEITLKELAVSNARIKLMGKTTRVAEAIQNASLFVLSSDFEGIPNALLEAMSIGVPCVSTDCSPGGAAMLIKNKVNGLLTPRGNAKKMAEAIAYMLENPTKAENMAQNAIQVNIDYSEEKIRKMWFGVLEYISRI